MEWYNPKFKVDSGYEDLWTELFFTNKDNLLKSIQGFEDQLDILKKAIKPKLLGIFIAICAIGIIVVGYVFNGLQYFLI